MRKLLLVFGIVLLSISGFAQNANSQAQKKYKQMAYAEAIPLFEYAIKKDSTDFDSMRKLAHSYRLTNNWPAAEKIYATLVAKDYNSYDRLYYAEALVINSKYALARKMLTHPSTTALQDARVNAILKSLDNIDELLYADTANVKVRRLPFNNDHADFAPQFYGNGIIFTSDRGNTDVVDRKHTWTGKRFVKMYFSSSQDKYETLEPFAPELHKRFNYGPGSFSGQSRSLYYSENGPKKKTGKGIKGLRIKSAELIDGKFKKTNEFNHNSREYACTHPAVTSDGNFMFFSSNMPGGYGGMDIYFSRKVLEAASSENNQITWTKPVNLGSKVNTPGDELFPFADKNNMLYFASNGHGGIGGLDIFVYNLKDTSKASENLGAPFNSNEDDFSLIISPDGTRGFFSSNRGRKGIDDDIYSFERLRPKTKPVFLVIIDSETKKQIDSSTITITGATLGTAYVPVSATGKFLLAINRDQDFTFKATAEGYDPAVMRRVISKDDTLLKMELNKLRKGCIVQGTITNKETKEKLDSVLVTIKNSQTKNVVFQTYTNNTGFYKFEGLEAEVIYEISASRNRYFSKETGLSTKGAVCVTAKSREYDYVRDLELDEIVIGRAIRIDNIYFDVNKFNIRSDAAIELDKIVTLMNENPEIIIELSSHTDARGSDQSNMTLSDNRAKSSAAYIISKGIAENRITGKGYGESMLVNRCVNGVVCTDKEHQQNRRTEFKVTGFLGKIEK